jgi:hypothetical protein
MGIETWIASDGRAYFVRLHEFDDSEADVESKYAEGQQVLEETFICGPPSYCGPKEPWTYGW